MKEICLKSEMLKRQDQKRKTYDTQNFVICANL